MKLAGHGHHFLDGLSIIIWYMDIYLNYKYTGTNDTDGIGRDMATTSIVSITEREVHRHRIALKTM